MTDIINDTPSKCGLVLKAAREEISLTLEQVAHQLHLRPSVVRAIEEENYDEFSSDVFLKGYFRTYCRLVNLHEERMMELLDQQLATRKQEAAHKEQQANKIVQAKYRKKVFMAIAMFLICASLVGLAYQLTVQSDGSDTTSLENTKDHNNAIDEQNDTGPLNNSSLPSNTSLLNSAMPVQNDMPTDTDSTITGSTLAEYETSPIEVTSSKLNDQADSVANSSLTESEEPIVEIEESSVSQNDTPMEEIEAGLNEQSVSPTESVLEKTETMVVSQLKANFVGDCWFQVKDGSGKTVIAGLKKSNDEVSYTGLTPFHIVIGDASQVRIYLDDNLVNLKPYTSRNGRAELTLRTTLPVSEG